MFVRTSIKSSGKAVSAAMRKAAVRAVTEVAEDMLTEANDRAPVDEGTLVRSSEVTVFPGDKVQAAVTYDTPYAARQHEDPTLNHPRQGEDHWLERTAEDNAERYFQHIGDAIRDATR